MKPLRPVAIGSVVFDQHASEVISELQKALDAPNYNWTLLEEAEEHLAAVRKAKEKLRPIALKDLGVK